MLATIRDDKWNVLNVQYTTSNSKRWDYSDILDAQTSPMVVLEKIKGPAHLIEGDRLLRKRPAL